VPALAIHNPHSVIGRGTRLADAILVTTRLLGKTSALVRDDSRAFRSRMRPRIVSSGSRARSTQPAVQSVRLTLRIFHIWSIISDKHSTRKDRTSRCRSAPTKNRRQSSPESEDATIRRESDVRGTCFGAPTDECGRSARPSDVKCVPALAAGDLWIARRGRERRRAFEGQERDADVELPQVKRAAGLIVKTREVWGRGR
jgi:hypothetical protein